jgi:transposase
LNNCNIHHSEEVCALIEDEAHRFFLFGHLYCLLGCLLDCKLIFLPSYLLYLNPIEQAFSVIKSHLQWHPEDFSLLIIDHAYQSITPEMAEGFFCSSDYIV